MFTENLHVADFSFLEGLFSILPFASDDVEARRAIWSVIARLLARVNESDIDTSCLRQYIWVFLSKSDVIEDDLLDIQLEEESLNSFPSQGKSSARKIAVSIHSYIPLFLLLLSSFFFKLACTDLFLTFSDITDTKD